MRSSWAVAVLGWGVALAQAPATDAEAMKIIEQVVRTHTGWSPALNTPGATLALQQISREGDTIGYQLHASGLPPGKLYTLMQWPVTGDPVVAMKGITFNEAGIAICAGNPGTCGTAERPNDPIRFVLRPAPGEPVRIAVTVENEPGIRALLKVVPVPNEGQDKGCRVQVVLLRPQAQIVVLEASGYAPDTELTMESVSEGERITARARSDGRGTYVSTLLPFVKGKSGGATRLKLSSSQCAPTLSFRWGQ